MFVWIANKRINHNAQLGTVGDGGLQSCCLLYGRSVRAWCFIYGADFPDWGFSTSKGSLHWCEHSFSTGVILETGFWMSSWLTGPRRERIFMGWENYNRILGLGCQRALLLWVTGRLGLNSDVVPVGGFGWWIPLLRVSRLGVWSYNTKVREDKEEEGDKSWQDPGPLLWGLHHVSF